MKQPLRNLHDNELAAQAAAGGRREFGELARRHGSAVRGLLRRMGAEASVADDIAQDAFLQAFQRCGEFRAEGPFVGWVKRIAARLYLKRRAHEARYVAEVETEDAAPASDTAGLMDLDEALKALSVGPVLRVNGSNVLLMKSALPHTAPASTRPPGQNFFSAIRSK